MATQSPSLILASDTPQHHYGWINGIDAALNALGVVNTTDTGQVTLSGQTSIPLPSGWNHDGAPSAAYASTTPVYRVYKLAATGLPTIYIRIDFSIYMNTDLSNAQNGSGQYESSINNSIPTPSYFYPSLKVSIGAITDGAGNITSIQPGYGCAVFATHQGVGNHPGQSYYTGSSSADSYLPLTTAGQNCDFASDGQNYLTMMIGENCPAFENCSIFDIAIERTINSGTGQYSGDGYVVYCGQNGGNACWTYVDLVNQREWSSTQGMPSISPPFMIGTSPTVAEVFPFIGSTLSPQGAPSVALSYYSNIISVPATFQAQLYSTAHTYKCCPRAVNSADPYNLGTTFALRFD